VSRRGVSRCLIAATMTGALLAAAAQESPKTIALMQFELLDDTGDRASDDAQKVRLAMITQQLRDAFTENRLYTVVQNVPAAALIADLDNRYALHDCNGCDVDIGRALNADRVLTAWVQKVSNLILNINIQIRDVKTGLIVLNKSVDIRGNTDESWSRGVRYMVRSMVEKNQANR
jgi:parvulin-like peptidyl-prolyl isomerase